MSRRHKDINKAHSLLYGEGWHIIETGQRKTNRRAKGVVCIIIIN